MEYEALRQAGESPLRYLGDIRQVERYIGKTYHQQAIAKRFVEWLDDSIRGRVLLRFEGEPKDQGYSMLEQIAGCAEDIWMNRLTDGTSSALQKMDINGRTVRNDRSPVRPTTNQRQPTEGSRIHDKKFHSSHHGPNNTHDSLDFLVLNGQL